MPMPAVRLNGSFPLKGLQPGTYMGTWWDTFAGAALSNLLSLLSVPMR